MNFDDIKTWIITNKTKVYIIAAVVVVIIGLSIWRFNAINTPEPVNEEEIPAVDKVQLTDEQQKIYNNYSNDIKDVLDILVNNRWVDETGNNNASFNEKQIIERGNEKEETQNFVICSMEKQTDTSTPYLIYNINLTFLMSDGKYYQVEMMERFRDKNQQSGIDTVVIKSDRAFSKAKAYGIVKLANNLTINNWQSNAEQFLDGHYNDMYNNIKDYMYKYYPQVSSITWEGYTIIDYNANKVSYTFALKTRSTVRIMATYYKNDGHFNVGKTTIQLDNKY